MNMIASTAAAESASERQFSASKLYERDRGAGMSDDLRTKVEFVYSYHKMKETADAKVSP